MIAAYLIWRAMTLLVAVTLTGVQALLGAIERRRLRVD